MDAPNLVIRIKFTMLALAVCLLSLAGLPPFFGFTARFSVLQAAIGRGLWWLAVAGAIQFLFVVFAAARVIATLYDRPDGSAQSEPESSFAFSAAAALAATVVLLMGLYPTPILTAARVAALNLVR